MANAEGKLQVFASQEPHRRHIRVVEFREQLIGTLEIRTDATWWVRSVKEGVREDGMGVYAPPAESAAGPYANALEAAGAVKQLWLACQQGSK